MALAVVPYSLCGLRPTAVRLAGLRPVVNARLAWVLMEGPLMTRSRSSLAMAGWWLGRGIAFLLPSTSRPMPWRLSAYLNAVNAYLNGRWPAGFAGRAPAAWCRCSGRILTMHWLTSRRRLRRQSGGAYVVSKARSFAWCPAPYYLARCIE